MERDIPINRKRIPRTLIIILIGFVALADTAFFSDNSHSEIPFNRVFCGIGAALLLLYVVIMLADYIKRRYDKNAALRITDTGIYDNSSIYSCGEIRWSDMEAMEIKNMASVDLLVIKVHDPYKYLSGKNPVIRYELKRMIKKWNTPIVISQLRFDYDLEKLHEELSLLLNANRTFTVS